MPNFPLSPYRQNGNLIFVSGQIGQEDGQLVSQDVKEQTKKAIANIASILQEAGVSLNNVLDVTAFITEQSDYDSFNEGYKESFSEPFPARTTVTVKSLPAGAKVELKAVAYKE